MGVLDNVGYKFAVQGGVMKISKGILTVMKENIVGNLYNLEGKIAGNKRKLLGRRTLQMRQT